VLSPLQPEDSSQQGGSLLPLREINCKRANASGDVSGWACRASRPPGQSAQADTLISEVDRGRPARPVVPLLAAGHDTSCVAASRVCGAGLGFGEKVHLPAAACRATDVASASAHRSL